MPTPHDSECPLCGAPLDGSGPARYVQSRVLALVDAHTRQTAGAALRVGAAVHAACYNRFDKRRKRQNALAARSAQADVMPATTQRVTERVQTRAKQPPEAAPLRRKAAAATRDPTPNPDATEAMAAAEAEAAAGPPDSDAFDPIDSPPAAAPRPLPSSAAAVAVTAVASAAVTEPRAHAAVPPTARAPPTAATAATSPARHFVPPPAKPGAAAAAPPRVAPPLPVPPFQPLPPPPPPLPLVRRTPMSSPTALPPPRAATAAAAPAPAPAAAPAAAAPSSVALAAALAAAAAATSLAACRVHMTEALQCALPAAPAALVARIEAACFIAAHGIVALYAGRCRHVVVALQQQPGLSAHVLAGRVSATELVDKALRDVPPAAQQQRQPAASLQTQIPARVFAAATALAVAPHPARQLSDALANASFASAARAAPAPPVLAKSAPAVTQPQRPAAAAASAPPTVAAKKAPAAPSVLHSVPHLTRATDQHVGRPFSTAAAVRVSAAPGSRFAAPFALAAALPSHQQLLVPAAAPTAAALKGAAAAAAAGAGSPARATPAAAPASAGAAGSLGVSAVPAAAALATAAPPPTPPAAVAANVVPRGSSGAAAAAAAADGDGAATLPSTTRARGKRKRSAGPVTAEKEAEREAARAREKAARLHRRWRRDVVTDANAALSLADTSAREPAAAGARGAAATVTPRRRSRSSGKAVGGAADGASRTPLPQPPAQPLFVAYGGPIVDAVLNAAAKHPPPPPAVAAAAAASVPSPAPSAAPAAAAASAVPTPVAPLSATERHALTQRLVHAVWDESGDALADADDALGVSTRWGEPRPKGLAAVFAELSARAVAAAAAHGEAASGADDAIRFVHLGSGRGKAVLAAAIGYTRAPVDAHGLEITESRVRAAAQKCVEMCAHVYGGGCDGVRERPESAAERTAARDDMLQRLRAVTMEVQNFDAVDLTDFTDVFAFGPAFAADVWAYIERELQHTNWQRLALVPRDGGFAGAPVIGGVRPVTRVPIEMSARTAGFSAVIYDRHQPGTGAPQAPAFARAGAGAGGSANHTSAAPSTV